jgi:hypothetical protein
MKDRETCTLLSVEPLIEVYLSANEPQTLRDEYSQATKILDTNAQKLCTIVFPWHMGKYKYKRLPMGMLQMFLARLSTSGMRVNISKSKFFVDHIE